VCRFPFRSWYGAFGNLGLLVAASALAVLVVGPMLGMYRTVTVLSGSMRPTFSPGDMIVVSPEPMSSLRVGDVITYSIPTAGHPVETHRVVSIQPTGGDPIVQTKGDANNTVDPWRAQLHGATVWRFRFRLPAFGYPLLWLRLRWVHLLTTMMLPLLLALYGLGRLWFPSRRSTLSNA
jgi:signal peptidase